MVGKDWSVTYITFKKNSVRGNHYHAKTVQKDFILSGKLICAKGLESASVVPGDSIIIEPGTPHAYLAIEDSEMVSVCFGERVGDNYSKDTYAVRKMFD